MKLGVHSSMQSLESAVLFVKKIGTARIYVSHIPKKTTEELVQCLRWVAFSSHFSSLQHKSGEMSTEDSWVSGCKMVLRNWIRRMSLISCFLPSREISQSPSSSLVSTTARLRLRMGCIDSGHVFHHQGSQSNRTFQDKTY